MKTHTETSFNDVTEFQWPVQIYDFQLSESNVFFLWLHSGDAGDQGSADDLSITSHYVNITTSASTSAAAQTAYKSSTTTSLPSTTTASTVQTSLTTIDSSSTTTTVVNTETNAPEESKTSSNRTLSASAKAGLGVSLCIICAAAMTGGVLLFRRRRRGRAIRAFELSGLQEQPPKMKPRTSLVITKQHSPAELPGPMITWERAELE